MKTIGIVGNGPTDNLPDLASYQHEIDCWIGADRGALTLLERGVTVDYALGDFDSISSEEKLTIQHAALHYVEYSSEKDETDIEIALLKAFELNPTRIILFAVTGGRIDHTLANIQLLLTIRKRNIEAVIVDEQNQIEMTLPGDYDVKKDVAYPNISFIPITERVKGLTLTGFYYPLTDAIVSFGSTLSISNKLLLNNGTFSYQEGILLFIKSRDLL